MSAVALSRSTPASPKVPARPDAARLDGVVKHYGGRVVLDGLDLALAGREIVTLLGKSGSGKTTILRLLADLEQPDEGQTQLSVGTGVVFQEHRLLPNKRVWENVVLGLGGSRRERRARAEILLREVGLDHQIDAWPGLLSGGEAQRVAVARALSRDPPYLLLDEPFAALDALTRLEVQSLVLRLRDQHGFGALLVTHDIDEAIALGDRIIVLREGRIVFDRRRAPGEARRRSDPASIRLRETLLGLLGVDVSDF